MNDYIDEEKKTEMKMRIAGNVAYYRSVRGYTQKELADMLGKSLGWVNKFEKFKPSQPKNQRVSFSRDTVDDIAKALKIPTAWLYDETLRDSADVETASRYDSDYYSFSEDNNRIRIPSSIEGLDSLVEELQQLTPEQLALLRVGLMKLDAKGGKGEKENQ